MTRSLQALQTERHDRRKEELRQPLGSAAPNAMIRSTISGISMARRDAGRAAASADVGRHSDSTGSAIALVALLRLCRPVVVCPESSEEKVKLELPCFASQVQNLVLYDTLCGLMHCVREAQIAGLLTRL